MNDIGDDRVASRSSDNPKNSVLVVILGMHRSGTSLTTRALQVLGIELGDSFHSPNRHNELGYWEDVDIQALNIEMLSALHLDWHSLAPISPDHVIRLREMGFQDQAKALLQGKLAEKAAFGVKDPRVTQLLPFWNEVFETCGRSTRYVQVIRNPLNVVRSIARRDSLAPVHAYYLWINHVFSGLFVKDEAPPFLVDYDRLLASPKKEIERLARHLDLPMDQQQFDMYAANIVDGRLRHFNSDLKDLAEDPNCPEIVLKTYTKLLDFSADRLKWSEIEADLQYWRDEITDLAPLFSHMDTLSDKSRSVWERHWKKSAIRNFGRSVFRALPLSENTKNRLRQMRESWTI